MFAANCPSCEELSAYALGKLPVDVSQAACEHIDTCPTCQAALAGLDDADDTLLARLRRPIAVDQFVQEPQCGQALAQLKAAAATSFSHGGISAGGPPSEATMLGQLGEYQLLEKLGQGGMGTVFKALHTKLRREVALKILPKNRLQDDHVIARFEREMAAVGALNHPNIVQAFDAREIEGTRFLVMEYVDGLDLTEMIRRLGPLPVPDVAALGRQAAKGLQAAHERRMVHRDVKPSNLMLARKGQLKILDLGLARFHHDECAGEEMTAVYQVMGTPDYMAPEQITNSHQVDIRADIYSLGCTMYKLLVGQPPFSGVRYQSIYEKQEAHAKHIPPPITRFRTDVPETLIAVIDRMMSKDAANRYATPDEVAADLEAFTAGCDLTKLLARALQAESPSVSPPWSGASTPQHRASALTAIQGAEEPWVDMPLRPARRRRKRRWLPVAAICLLVAGLGALGVWRWQSGLWPWEKNPGAEDVATAGPVLSHDHEVWSVAFSPDNRTLVSAGVEQVIKIWNITEASNKPWRTLPGHDGQGEVRWVTFSPDGSTLASADEDGTIQIWNAAANFEKGHKIAAHDGEARSLAFSADGGLLVSGGYDSTVKFWDPSIGDAKEPRSIDAHVGSVLSVAHAPNAEIVASAGSDSTVKLWDAMGEEIATLRGHSGGVRCVVFSPEGRTLASGSADHTIKLWDVMSSRLLRTLEGHTGEVRCIAFSPDGKMLVSGGNDATIRFWDVRSGRHKDVLVGHTGEVTSVAFTPDGRKLASASADKTVRLWNIRVAPSKPYEVPQKVPDYYEPSKEPEVVADFVQRAVLTGHEGAVRSLAFSPSGDKLASAAADQTIRLWDMASGEPTHVLGGMSAEVRSVTFSHDGENLTAADGSETIKIWEVDKPGEKPRVLKGNTGPVRAVAFSPEGDTLASGGDGKKITLWDLKSGSQKKTFEGFDQGISALTYSPDGKLLIAGGEEWVTFYYPDSALHLGAFRALTEGSPVAAISANGKTMAKTSRNASILLWDLRSDREQATLVGHRGPVRSIAFSPNGSVVVSAGDENGFRVWDSKTGNELGVSAAHKGEVLAIAFSPDGKTMASAGADREIILWDVRVDVAAPPKETPPKTAPGKKAEKGAGR